MKDGIINETKNSRLIKADLPATYDQLRSLAATDGLPIDLLINLAGWHQMPSWLNKNNLLPQDIVTLLGLDGLADPQVKDALLALTVGAGKYAFKFNVTYSNGLPASGVTITGVLSLNGSPCITNAEGVAIGVSTTQAVTVTINMSDCVDIRATTTKNLSGTSGAVAEVPITIVLQSTLTHTVLTSGSIKFSSAVDTVDFCAAGAGGGGQGGAPLGGGGNGGGGGYVANQMNRTVIPFHAYTVTIGAAGVGGTGTTNSATRNPGTAGGTTSVAGIVGASGGGGGNDSGGGSGNGTGGKINGPAATHGTGSVFNENIIKAGGGGGAGYMYGSTWNASGLPNGGQGGIYYGNYENAGPGGIGGNVGGGGGGGGGGTAMSSSRYGGNGGNGCQGYVYLRWRYKTV